MSTILLECFLFISIGYLLRKIKPLAFDAETTRKSIISLVYIVLLPALIIKSLWTTKPELIQINVSISVLLTIMLTMLIVWLTYRFLTTNKATLGTLILAGAFSNATYQGLPILQHQLHELGTAVAIQYDFFAQTPLLLTLGVLIAKYFSPHQTVQSEHSLITLAKVPALWAALIGLTLNQSNITPIEPLLTWLTQLSQPVVPLMLISIGLGFKPESIHRQDLPILAPIIIIRLLITPLIILIITHWFELNAQIVLGLVLEAAMSSMLIAIVLIERYHLDHQKFTEIVTLTLLLSLGTLPLWQWLLTSYWLL